MAVDIFLKLEDIKGESKDSKHRDEIVIESFSWGEANDAAAAGGEPGRGKVDLQDFHFTMPINLASPLIAFRCADGQHLRDAFLTCRKAGETQLEFLKVKFEDVVISSYQSGGSDADAIPMDSFSLFFNKIELTYTSQKPDGSPGPFTTFIWDRTKPES